MVYLRTHVLHSRTHMYTEGMATNNFNKIAYTMEKVSLSCMHLPEKRKSYFDLTALQKKTEIRKWMLQDVKSNAK